MRNSYYNSEGYYDPTAGAAIANIVREERRINRKPRKKPQSKKRRTTVWRCKP
jgi:hypothetical protein